MARQSKRRRDERRFGRPERLADMIAQDGIFDPVKKRQMEGTILDAIKGSAVFDIQSITDYMDVHFKGKPFDIAKEIPNLRPQFKHMFFEFDIEAGRRAGVYLFNPPAFKGRLDSPLDIGVVSIPGGTESMVFLMVFEELAGRCVGPSGVGWVPLDGSGKVLGGAGVKPCCASKEFTNDELCSALGMYYMAPAFMSIALMHCKNVATVAVDPDRALNRERMKAGLKPFLRYHTININPMREVLRTEGGIKANGLRRALHICRGHFATLTRNNKGEALENPVTYFREAHVRGSAKDGVVVSDYRVNPAEPRR